MANKGRLHFFFEHGAGDHQTHNQLGSGPVDCGRYDLTGELKAQPALSLSPEVRRLINVLSKEQSDYLNPHYPMDPSLWRQERCRRFNDNVEQLLKLLTLDLAGSYNIIDRQERYAEDPDLDAYMKDPKRLRRS